MTFLVVFYLLLIWLVVTMAKTRGRDPAGWGLLALVLGPFTVLVLLAAGTSEAERIRRAEAEEIAREHARQRLGE